jgi:hypothetical protein
MYVRAHVYVCVCVCVCVRACMLVRVFAVHEGLFWGHFYVQVG